MGVSLFYLLALIPVGIGGWFWLRSREVIWQEWAIGCAAALALSGLFHVLAVRGMTRDIETWSGQIESSTHHPRWVEKYTVTHHHSSGSGKNRRTWTTTSTHYRTHQEHWTAETTLETVEEITEEFYLEIKIRFGGKVTTEQPHKSGFHTGDRNTYVVYNATDFVYPVTTLRHWENRVKAAPSLFSFSKVPSNVVVHPWPQNPDWLASERLVGEAGHLFNLTEFDRLNARLGPTKKVNLILVGFPEGTDSQMGHWQEAAWIGGKKNDLVVTFCDLGTARPATWAYAFGWTESALCKRNLESLFVSQVAGNALLAAVEKEIRANYQPKDWSKFDYITVDVPRWSYVVFLLFLGGTQTGLYVFFHRNEFAKSSFRSRFR